MLNIFTKPFEQETLDDWAKLSVDIAKVAILAIPVILYGKDILLIKFINIFLLSCGIYSALIAGRKLRKMKEGD
ncbi:hypothetical protein Q7469_03310 [Glaesserella parasuis]|uniref:Uncharacterized protein n=1 Tax=Glaesserella parasuis TaxID=738 RepID=A0A084F0X0_GLAPU|nr:hypothetical protein [Glaesserella parasuis]EQA02162.1 hypothetical protein HPSSW114_0788 [Glaesserella parasuis SW114]ATW42506.1 hypothetical protein A2U20_01130 [Glaesserella parasuis D74]EQA09449.1 hypothetical protein HPSD74_1420 [Glaesserella parasuis D74]KEZ23862.1 hypothetical protein HS327_00147 [Glaesserella parasuis]MCT8558573.1 hypothetical protein [Glaesserella parasuis]